MHKKLYNNENVQDVLVIADNDRLISVKDKHLWLHVQLVTIYNLYTIVRKLFDRKYFIDKKFKVKYFCGYMISSKYFYLEVYR